MIFGCFKCKKEINEKKLSDDNIQSKENNADVPIDDIDDLFDQLISDMKKPLLQKLHKV